MMNLSEEQRNQKESKLAVEAWSMWRRYRS